MPDCHVLFTVAAPTVTEELSSVITIVPSWPGFMVKTVAVPALNTTTGFHETVPTYPVGIAYATAGLPLYRISAALIVAVTDPVFFTFIVIVYVLPETSAYAVVNSTFSYFVKLLPSPSSQYATAIDIVMAMATMMMVAMTGLTAFTFPRRVLRSLNFKFVFSSKNVSSIFCLFSKIRDSLLLVLQLESRWILVNK
jgi:hypothetical protein